MVLWHSFGFGNFPEVLKHISNYLKCLGVFMGKKGPNLGQFASRSKLCGFSTWVSLREEEDKLSSVLAQHQVKCNNSSEFDHLVAWG